MSLAGICSMATRHVLAELAAMYRESSGIGVAIESVGGVDAARRVRAAEPFDFVVLAAEAIETLEKAGSVLRGTRVDVAGAAIAVAVPAGARLPDIGDEAALRAAIRGARSVAYSTGPSGAHLEALLERWDIGGSDGPRLVQAPPGIPVAALIARGEADLGFQQLSELIHESGIDIAGVLPPQVQRVTVFSAAICTTCTQRETARGFLEFIASPQADATKRRHGMESARPQAGRH